MRFVAYLDVGEHDLVGDFLDVLLDDFGLIFVLETKGEIFYSFLFFLHLGLV